LIAVQLKPDIANVHYNLAYVFRNLKDYANEKQALETTLKYTEQGSDDYKKVEGELRTVSLQLEPEEQKPATNLPISDIMEQSPLATPAAEPRTQVTPEIEIAP
jgi:predicted metal-dependent hydrolase